MFDFAVRGVRQTLYLAGNFVYNLAKTSPFLSDNTEPIFSNKSHNTDFQARKGARWTSLAVNRVDTLNIVINNRAIKNIFKSLQ